MWKIRSQSLFCRTDIFKKSVDKVEIKLYNNLSSYLKNLKNTQLLYKESKTILITIYLPFHRGIFV